MTVARLSAVLGFEWCGRLPLPVSLLIRGVPLHEERSVAPGIPFRCCSVVCYRAIGLFSFHH
jgi:hypothetical protein